MSRPLLRLLRLTGPFRWSMGLAVVLGAATVGSGIALMATSALLISRAALRPSIADLSLLVVGVRFFGIARGILRYLERYVSHDVGLRLLARLRVWFFEIAEPLAPARLISHKSGDLLTRAVADIETLKDLYVRMVAPPAVALMVAVAVGLYLWRFDPWLAVVWLGFFLAAGVAVPVIARLTSRRPGAAFIATRSDLQAELVDSLQGMADVVAFGQSGRRSEAVRRTAGSLAAAQRRMAWIAGLQSALGSLVINGAVVAVLVLAIARVEAGRLEGVHLAMLVLLAAAAFEAVVPLGPALQALEGVLAAARRLFALADIRPAVSDPLAPLPRRPTPEGGGVGLEVRNLRFSYADGEPPALRGVSFSLPPGRRVAIVGPSGAGKSTLVNLLLRFWDYTEGEILLNGVDLRRYAQADVRRIFSVIPQQAYLFSGTVRENILLAKPEATEAEVEAAARRAQLQAFARSAPHGYDSWVGEGGLRLSGGERQRLALARVLLRDAPIVILDEPTANLDPVTERALLAEFWDALAGRSLLMITHRWVGLDAMDEILVLQHGEVIQRGRYDALAAAGGWFASAGGSGWSVGEGRVRLRRLRTDAAMPSEIHQGRRSS
jgi:thiol reductant ABC exporter CydC subunit